MPGPRSFRGVGMWVCLFPYLFLGRVGIPEGGGYTRGRRIYQKEEDIPEGGGYTGGRWVYQREMGIPEGDGYSIGRWV